MSLAQRPSYLSSTYPWPLALRQDARPARAEWGVHAVDSPQSVNARLNVAAYIWYEVMSVIAERYAVTLTSNAMSHPSRAIRNY